MTINKLTEAQLLFRLQDFYGAEQDASEIGDHEYAQECADIVSVIRELQEYRKELPGGLFELQNIKSDARAISTRLKDALTRNSKQAIKIGVYERIYGPLRECPGEASIYPAGQHSHGCKTFFCLAGHHHIGEYMFGSHTHSVTGGKNDA
ncbi:hypothetical protein [Enterobacter hormaechei]|uniref:hypothetical protein n=1 Tax=Enterobacter hormaechei TaxID=158836 RepID=UPI003D6ED45B